jgi:putative transposase
VEPIIHGYLRTKAIGLGTVVFAVNSIEDHVHMVVSIPPKLAVATFVGQVKAVASTKFNQSHQGEPFSWQAEYGAFSFDGKRLPNYVAYVERQKEHHANQRMIPILERMSGEGVQLIREDHVGYAFEDELWRREMEGLG